MYTITREKFDTFLEKISKEMNLKIDTNSFDYEILLSLFNTNQSFKNEYEKILNSIIFEDMKGNDLDSFLSFFNLFRKRETNDNLVDVTVSYSSVNGDFKILTGCLIIIEGQSYKVLKDVVLSGNTTFTVQRTFNDEINNQLISRNGSIIFDSNYIESFSPQDEVSKILLLGLKDNISEEESDFEFLERSKSVLQNLGYNNHQKIKFEILKDNRVKDVKIVEKENVCHIIVYPNSIEDLDEIISTNKHIVDYYRDRNIELVKPNLITIDIVGLSEQISYLASYNTIISELTEKIVNYLNSIYIEDNKVVIKKNELIMILIKYFNDVKNVDLDISSIDFSYNFYFRNNFEKHLYSKTIEKELVVNDNNLISFGKVI